MGLFDFFKKKSNKGNQEMPPLFSELTVVDDGAGTQTLRLLDPISGSSADFPPVDILLRDLAGLDQTQQQLRNAGAADQHMPVQRPIAEGVVEVLGLDKGQSFTILSEDNLRKEGLTYDLARKGALARLRSAVADLNIEGGGGRYRVTFPDDLDMTASFVLISEDWLDLQSISGTPVFAVGTRVSIHVCGSEDADSLDGMRKIAEVMYAESSEDPVANGKPLTPMLLTIEDGQIVPFDRKS